MRRLCVGGGFIQNQEYLTALLNCNTLLIFIIFIKISQGRSILKVVFIWALIKVPHFWQVLLQKILKVLRAIAHGIWLVSFDWVELSLSVSKGFAAEEHFEMHGDGSSGKCDGPKKSRLRHKIESVSTPQVRVSDFL